MAIYDFTGTIDGEKVSLSDFKGKVLIVVNTASKCGFTPQYKDLQKIYNKYKAQGLEILGFPCNQFAEQEPGNNSEIKEFCEINYGVTFPIFDKIDVKGPEAHPLFKYLISKAPFEGFDKQHAIGKILYAMLSEKFPADLVGDSVKWNFTKFLVNRDGEIVKRFEPTVDPLDMEDEIKKIL
ncbi:MAG: Peroxiredoxin [Anaerosolibacter sp.]|jgi:glutathione peroxidase|uniref:glutathione peroxidase n=1 Tax=Anaerosolibacter sp. TaxID=1872527 RepID=UPI00262F878C|nr:glutathione peroxidase [Anaerosolibacter sp.]MDF2548205.1 Peroxiredoxin [Anaerosolibacter sp.]